MSVHTLHRLRVMSLNIRKELREQGAAHLEEAVRLIEEWNPDLVGLQEVSRWLPPTSPQPALLDELLEFEITFERCSGLLPNGYGLALASRVNPDLVHEVELPGGQEPCRVQDARFSWNGHFVHLVNTRLGGSQQQRYAQVERLATRLRKYRRPVILLGDFDSAPDSNEVQALGAAGLLPARTTDPWSYRSKGLQCRSSYVMVSRHFRVEEAVVFPSATGAYQLAIATLVLADPDTGAVAL